MDISITSPLYSCVYHDQHDFVIFADLRFGVTQGQVLSYCSNMPSRCLVATLIVNARTITAGSVSASSVSSLILHQ